MVSRLNRTLQKDRGNVCKPPSPCSLLEFNFLKFYFIAVRTLSMTSILNKILRAQYTIADSRCNVAQWFSRTSSSCVTDTSWPQINRSWFPPPQYHFCSLLLWVWIFYIPLLFNIFSLSIHLLMDIQVISPSWLLWLVLPFLKRRHKNGQEVYLEKYSVSLINRLVQIKLKWCQDEFSKK